MEDTVREETRMPEAALTIWTIGHSTRTIGGFIEMLRANAIQALADVRRFPSSRKYPHFNEGALREALAGIGCEYVPFPELGGRRRPDPTSHNIAWRNQSFRGYADYMETHAFGAGVQRLLDLARQKRTVIMCAEAVWWRCHRALIADYLKVRGVSVMHIMDSQQAEPHPYTSAAQIREGNLTYSAPASRQSRD